MFLDNSQTESSASFSNNAFAETLRFIDLFAGLGGFHVGLSRLGVECVFASELDPELRKLYANNFGILPEGDIRQVDEKTIPKHDILCAGFPCQPFSIAGKKKGAKCPSSGKLIDDVLRIVEYHEPKFVLLENVPSILTIANGKFWQYIKKSFNKLGYQLDYRIYSPHEFGIPQKRQRVFVVAAKEGFSQIAWPITKNLQLLPIIQNTNTNLKTEIRNIEPQKLQVLNKWQALVNHTQKMVHHSILAPEFGANYPLDGIDHLGVEELSRFKGAFGKELIECSSREEMIKCLPKYMQNGNERPPAWIKNSIIYSRDLYKMDIPFFDEWKIGMIEMPISWQKLEWRGMRDDIDIWKHIIQFRASGIRILRAEYAPSLVAMTPTQTPILGVKKRYMTVNEAAALQSLQSLKELPTLNSKAFKALGNAVNAFIVQEIASKLVDNIQDK